MDAAPALLCAEEVELSGVVSLEEALSAFAGELSRTARTALARRKHAGGSIAAPGLVGVAVVVTIGWDVFDNGSDRSSHEA